MKTIKKRRLIVFVLCLSMVLSSFVSLGLGQAPSADAAKKAKLKTKSIKVEVGKTKKITIKNKNSKNKYTFTSNKKKVATVSKKGVVKGKKAGSAKITVKEKAGKKTKTLGKVSVKVTKKQADNTTPSTNNQTNTNTNQNPQNNPNNNQNPSNPDNGETVATADIYVAEDGNDSGSGTKDSPFKTLEKAKEAVRAMSKNKSEIIVEIEDGFYKLAGTVEFDEEDSGTDDSKIIYRAAKGANPIFSGGERLDEEWEVASEVNWLRSGLTCYKAPLDRDDKLRAIYVNGERASMTGKSQQPKSGNGNYQIQKGQADWAWAPTQQTEYTGCTFDGSFLNPETRNPQNIEIKSSSTWAQQLVCVQDVKRSGNDAVVTYQMPYAAFAQDLGWGTGYSPNKTNDVANVYEWLANPGEFYFDQENSTLYYIPRSGEDIDEAEVIIPDVEILLDVHDCNNITFDGLTFAYSDYNLFEVDGSRGYASVQGAIVMKAHGLINQHDDVYRSYDVPSAAVHVTSCENVNYINGAIRNTGCLGIHLENAVTDCAITGNYIGKTGGGGIVIGHPTHVYENDTSKHKVNANNSVGPEKEKFRDGTEAVPTNILISNNYMPMNCYFFPGHSPITSFYTYNMQVLHNFIYKCSYSGMSIGWGWCNFDGSAASAGDIQLPGIPTTTSRNNHVNYNRVEEICSLLQDAGGIYTLGQQGEPDQWSEMSFNYINAKRTPQVANGSKMINGFHPDEGSAYIIFEANVVTNIIRNVYELNNWRRKHDMKVINGFSNTDRSETTAPNCTLDQTVKSDYVWPMKGYETCLNSGLEDQYTYMIEQDVIPDTDYELASNVRLEAGSKLKRRGLLSADDEVWLAPKGTSNFVEGDNMVKAPGNVKEMDIPSTPGEYKCYVVYENGDVSDESTFTLYVGEENNAANVADGVDYNVSKINPLTLELDTANYNFRLNNNNVNDGYKISTTGKWTLTCTPKNGGSTISLFFTTSITDANKLLEQDVTVSSEGEVRFATPLYDASKTIWLAPSGLSAFADGDPTMSRTNGNSASMKAPKQAGTYILTVVDSAGGILSQSDAFVTVE